MSSCGSSNPPCVLYSHLSNCVKAIGQEPVFVGQLCWGFNGHDLSHWQVDPRLMMSQAPCLSFQESNGLLTIWHWELGCLLSQEIIKGFLRAFYIVWVKEPVSLEEMSLWEWSLIWTSLSSLSISVCTLPVYKWCRFAQKTLERALMDPLNSLRNFSLQKMQVNDINCCTMLYSPDLHHVATI